MFTLLTGAIGETFKSGTREPSGDYVGAADYTALRDALREALDLAVRYHYNCEDCWYSCSTLTCDAKRYSEKCDCGADDINKRISELRAQFLES